jgi:hypothetical protein
MDDSRAGAEANRYAGSLAPGAVPREWLDAGELPRHAPRAFSQEISRYAFERARDPAGEPVAGVHYLSRLEH